MFSWKDVTMANSLGGASYLLEQGKKARPADQVEGLGQVNEGQVEGASLFEALFLKLSNRENHVNG